MADSNGHFPLAHESDDLIPLPDAHRQGLTAVAVLAAISIVSSTAVLVYLTVKLIRWHIKTSREARRQALRCSSVDLSLGLAERYFSRSNDDSSQHGRGPPVPSRTTEKVYPNQFLVLLYNLLLADIHQSGAFLLNAVWVGRNGIEVRKATCFAQGWLVSTGDLASSCFITAIAVHTYMAVVWHYKPPQWALYVAIVGLWVFDYLMAALGLVTTNNGREFGGFYVRAAAWCWVNVKYDTHRLVLHYLFIFISLAVTSVLYLLIFLSLRKRRRQESPDLQLPSNSTNITGHHHQNANSTSSSTSTTTTHTSTTNKTRNTTTTTTNPSPTNRNNTIARANSGGHHNAFLLYPVIYVICTAPLALGRIATMAGAQVPISYFCTAGALITSNGWLDVLLWGVTRHSLLFGGDIGSQESGLDTFAFMRTPPERRYGNIVWVEGSAGPQSRRGGMDMGQEEGEGGEGGYGWFGRLSWIRKRMGWERLVGLGGGGGGIQQQQQQQQQQQEYRKERRARQRQRGRTTSSQEYLKGQRQQQGQEGYQQQGQGQGQGDLAIQMDTVTSVVVEVTDRGDTMGEGRQRGENKKDADNHEPGQLPPTEREYLTSVESLDKNDS